MRPTIIRAAAQCGITALTAWIMLRILYPAHLPYLWPLTSFQLAVLWPDWPTPRARYLHLALAGTTLFTMGLFLGVPLIPNLFFPLIETIELWATVHFLYPRMQRFEDLEHQDVVAHFARVIFLVSLVASALLALFPLPGMPIALTERWAVVTLAHIVGTATLTPAILFLLSINTEALLAERQAYSRAPAALLATVAVTLYVFSQTSYPWLFLIFPPLAITLLTSGMKGAALVTPIIAAIACWGTAHHLGPVWTHTNPEIPTIALQAFLLTIVSTALAIGASLDQRQTAERNARAGQSIYLTLLSHAQDMILLSSLDGTQRYISPGVTTLTGFSPEEFLKLPPLDTMHEEDRPVAETVLASLGKGKQEHNFRYRIRCKDGGYQWVEAFVRGYSDSRTGKLTGYVATIHDITELTSVEEAWTTERTILASRNSQLAELAGSDELTGLANRRTFNRMLSHEIARHKRAKGHLSLIMLDIDHFKLYNDRYGHPAGDACLKQVAAALKTSRASDVAARIGGEEFAVILPDTDSNGALRVAERLLEQVRSLSIEHERSPMKIVTISIGTSTWPPGFFADESCLIQSADRALYESKGSGRNRVTTLTESLEPTAKVS